MPPWNGWYHCMSSTYAGWLPGDKRGWRTRHHREHIEGDYKHPPAKPNDGLHRASKRSLKRLVVVLTPEARQVALAWVHRTLVKAQRLEVLAISVSGMHLHVLLRLPPPARGTGLSQREKDPPRYFVGLAKERAAKALADAGLVEPCDGEGACRGTVWGKRGKIVPVRDRKHQVQAFGYILDHRDEGAAVWSFRDPEPAP